MVPLSSQFWLSVPSGDVGRPMQGHRRSTNAVLIAEGIHAWWRSGAVTVTTSKCHDQCGPTAEMASTGGRS